MTGFMEAKSNGVARSVSGGSEQLSARSLRSLLVVSCQAEWFRLATGNWQLATGNWQLATGNWQLATGNWQLATGNWQLATGAEPHASAHWLSSALPSSLGTVSGSEVR
jgi:hypothetical protein